MNLSTELAAHSTLDAVPSTLDAVPSTLDAVPASAKLQAEIEALVLAAAPPQDDNDFPLGQACDLSGEGTCEACQ